MRLVILRPSTMPMVVELLSAGCVSTSRSCPICCLWRRVEMQAACFSWQLLTYALGHDYVLRVPRKHPHFIATARKEAIVVPAARAAGVRTPMIVVFDDSRELLPVPYTIYERIHGATL